MSGNKIAYGMLFGVGLRMVLFDNIALGAGAGMAIGVAIGAGLDAQPLPSGNSQRIGAVLQARRSG